MYPKNDNDTEIKNLNFFCCCFDDRDFSVEDANSADLWIRVLCSYQKKNSQNSHLLTNPFYQNMNNYFLG